MNNEHEKEMCVETEMKEDGRTITYYHFRLHGSGDDKGTNKSTSKRADSAGSASLNKKPDRGD